MNTTDLLVAAIADDEESAAGAVPAAECHGADAGQGLGGGIEAGLHRGQVDKAAGGAALGQCRFNVLGPAGQRRHEAAAAAAAAAAREGAGSGGGGGGSGGAGHG